MTKTTAQVYKELYDSKQHNALDETCVNCIQTINGEGKCETYDCFFEGRKTRSIRHWINSVVESQNPEDKRAWVTCHMCDLPIANNAVGFRIKDKSELNTKDAQACLDLSFIEWTEELYKNPLFSKARKENAAKMMIEIDQMIRYDLRGEIFDQKLKSILSVFRDIYVLEGIFRDIIDACWTMYVKYGKQLDNNVRHLPPALDMWVSLGRVKDFIEERLADMKKIDKEHGGSYTKQERLKKTYLS